MRISTSQMYQSGVRAMQRAQADLNHTSLQMATGRRIFTAADDPSGATQSIQLDAAINTAEQFQRNGNYALPKLEQEESQLIGLDNALQRVRELVVTGNSDTYNPENRKVLASEIRQLRDDILGIANTQDANGEYLFAGTRAQTAPFVTGDDARISYVGASGTGAVREIALTSTRRIATGDTGAEIFMEIPERSGLVTEAVPAVGNAGSLAVVAVAAADLQEALNSAGETLRIVFKDDAGTMNYQVLDLDGNAVQDASGHLIGGPYVPNVPLEFAGRRITLSGPPTAPADGDEILSRPVKQVSLFKTLDDIATALESPVTDEDSRAALSQASSMALRNLDSSLDRVNEVRTSVGLRINLLDTQAGLNDERVLDLKTTLSEVRDLDYAEAISHYKQQEAVLQAAQQTYVQVNQLSLFNFL